MLKQTRIGAVVFFVADVERTRRFYGGVLGLDCEMMEGHDGQFLLAHVQDTVLVFFAGDEKPARTPIVVFSVGEQDIGTLVDELVAQNVEIIAPVQEAPDGGLTADFLDPDGHVLSLHKARTEPAGG